MSDTPDKALRQSKRAHLFAIIGLIALGTSGPAAMNALVSPMVGMLGNLLAAIFFLIAFIIGLRALWTNKKTHVITSTITTWVVVVLSGGLVAAMLVMMTPSGAPPIHDISTDLVNPPEFVEIVALREADGAQNPPEYLDDGSAELQKAAFPELVTITVDRPARDVFPRALRAANDMGWEVVAASIAEGRIEAIATTSFVGFKDDVVIRITDLGDSSAIDIRSKSRIGKGDMGKNAERIMAWQKKFESKL